MSESKTFGPTLDEMRDPTLLPEDLRARARATGETDPLDPINVYNLSWRQADGSIPHVVLPKALTGVDANIIVMSGRKYPTGSHKVGPAYSIVREYQMAGKLDKEKHTLVFPSTGNFGIGGAWVGPRMGYKSLVVLPEEMSTERFEKIRGYGADIIATPGCESNVKEIYDKVNELRRDPSKMILNQFAEMGNYRFHYYVTGHAALDLAKELGEQGVGNGRVAGFISAMGSSGTIAAGDMVKQHNPGAVIVGLEPIQCPTLYNVGFGGHKIEGIGDKHVTWIHRVTNTDMMMCIDDDATVRGVQLIQEGSEWLAEGLGIDPSETAKLVDVFGMSGVCNVLGAIKTAKFLGLGPDDNLVTLATDGFDRYPSVMRNLDKAEGPMTRDVAMRRIEIFHGAGLDHILEGSREVQLRWHNQKYFTWVEQQGMTTEELQETYSDEFWIKQQEMIPGLDAKWSEQRGF